MALSWMLNSKLLGLLSGVDREKLEQVSNMVSNMSKEDLNNLVNMLGINNIETAEKRSEEETNGGE